MSNFFEGWQGVKGVKLHSLYVNNSHAAATVIH